MKEFKVGDKVKVLSESYGGTFKGVTGTVIKISETNHPDFPYDVDFEDEEVGGWPFNPNELELLEVVS